MQLPPTSTSFAGDPNFWYRLRISLALSSLSLQILVCLTASNLQESLFSPYLQIPRGTYLLLWKGSFSSFWKPLSVFPLTLLFFSSLPINLKKYYITPLHTLYTLKIQIGEPNPRNRTPTQQRQEQMPAPLVTPIILTPDASTIHKL